jgi:ribulose-phosphate 3-epimerase
LKYELAPSILSFDLTTLSTQAPKLMAAGAHIIHLDVMDGQFVPPISFGDVIALNLKNHVNARMEAHLMTMTPERHFDAFIDAGCERIIFHAEATMHAHRLVQYLHSKGIKAGVAINPATPVDNIATIIDEIDMALVMTINPGWGGQKLIPSTLNKIRQVRALRADLDIQVDGGVDPVTLPQVIEAGANVFVVGSYLLRAPTLEEGVESILSGFPSNS